MRGVCAFSSAKAAASLPSASISGVRVARGVAAKSARLQPGQQQRCSSSWRRDEPAPPFAFAFDIDGVLLHVAKPTPGATETLRFLNESNIPFILLTNGGGKREVDRVKDLSEKLGVPLTIDNFVQSHTPFKQLVDGPASLRNKTILVTGSDYEKCRAIAKSYGFQNVVTPADILAAHPSVFPFRPITDILATAQPLPRPLFNTTSTTPLEETLRIDAMFVFDDPRDWAADVQLITDLLLSRSGYLGTYSALNGNESLPSCGWQQDGQPPLYFSNGDLLWSATYHLPRFGQGAFQAAIAGVWHRVTGGHELQRRVIGKPQAETYEYAERVLGVHRHDILKSKGFREPGTLKAVYMVGDNPESDIAGANGHSSENGTQWTSVLVKTGVWSKERGGEKALQGRLKPKVIVADVKEAVKWALVQEGWKGTY
ncbi:HAD-like domain-containing protein [Lasiosphaeria hispida]|uniref:HAD-like domain-containing protein n=1 Tax=Lasiosphaeria hispida TaxID=260671 RepID=A0AAJ0HVI6_9PEZI|nr:HAD-like domain-containing protein [Lasiosphaeria hispida]